MLDIKDIVSETRKALKFHSLVSGSDFTDPVDLVSTGNLPLDHCLGGGFAFKFIVQLLGKSRSGKTLLMLRTAAEAQRKYDAVIVWCDREGAFVRNFAEKLGVNMDKLLLVGPSDIPSPREAFMFLSKVHSTLRDKDENAYIVMCIDSIAAFTPSAEESTSDDMGRVAKGLHRGFRTITMKMDDRTLFLFSNQIQQRVGIMFGKSETPAGGMAPEYYSSYILELDPGRQIKDDKGLTTVGQWIECEAIKTRLGPAYRGCEIPFYYDTGYDYYGGFFRWLVSQSAVEPTNKSDFKACKSTNYTTPNGTKYREDEVERFIKENDWK